MELIRNQQEIYLSFNMTEQQPVGNINITKSIDRGDIPSSETLNMLKDYNTAKGVYLDLLDKGYKSGTEQQQDELFVSLGKAQGGLINLFANPEFHSFGIFSRDEKKEALGPYTEAREEVRGDIESRIMNFYGKVLMKSSSQQDTLVISNTPPQVPPAYAKEVVGRSSSDTQNEVSIVMPATHVPISEPKQTAPKGVAIYSGQTPTGIYREPSQEQSNTEGLGSIFRGLPHLSGPDFEEFSQDTMKAFSTIAQAKGNRDLLQLISDITMDTSSTVFEKYQVGNTVIYKRTSQGFVSNESNGYVFGHESFMTGFNMTTGEQQGLFEFEIRAPRKINDSTVTGGINQQHWIGLGIMPDTHANSSERNGAIAFWARNAQDIEQTLSQNPAQAVLLHKISGLGKEYLVHNANGNIIGVNPIGVRRMAEGLEALLIYRRPPGETFGHFYVQDRNPVPFTGENIKDDFEQVNPYQIARKSEKGLRIRTENGVYPY